MPFIVAGVLKKFISNKPGQTAPAEDAGSGEIPPTPPAAKPFTVTPQTPVMEDIPPDKNNLSKDVAIKGTVKFVKEFVFDGNLEGEISSDDGILTIGEKADVRGEVKSKTVIVKGKVHGNITVKERCELHSRSQLIGDLKAARLVIEEGATFLGKSEVAPDKNIIKDLGGPPPAERRAEESRCSKSDASASDAVSKLMVQERHRRLPLSSCRLRSATVSRSSSTARAPFSRTARDTALRLFRPSRPRRPALRRAPASERDSPEDSLTKERRRKQRGLRP